MAACARPRPCADVLWPVLQRVWVPCAADGASLRLDDVRTIPAGFEARNGATTYRLSATELVVIDGETLYSRDPIVEYREARP